LVGPRCSARALDDRTMAVGAGWTGRRDVVLPAHDHRGEQPVCRHTRRGSADCM